MKNVWILLKVQLLNFFGINKILHSNDKKEKNKAAGFLALMVFLFLYIAGMAFFVCYGLGQSFRQLGVLELFPPLVMAMVTMMILLTTIFKVNGTLFGFKDYDTIMSLPVKTGEIVASRLILVYTMNTFFAFIIMIPAGAVYALLSKPAFGFYPIYFLLMLAVPLVPIIVASAIGTVISMISSRFKRSGVMNLLVSLVFMIGIMVVSFLMGGTAGSGNMEAFTDIGRMISEMTNKIYPLALLFTSAICDMNILAFLGFIAISAALFGGFSYLVGVMFKWLNTGAMTTRATANYQLQEMKTSTPFFALYKKEIKRFFSSTLYVMNSGVGSVMLLIMAVAVAVFGSGTVDLMLDKMSGLAGLVENYAPLLFAGMVAMSSTTAAAISLEGKNLWVIKSLPLSEKTIFDAKIAVNLTILVPSIVISAILLIFSFKFSPLAAIILLILPIGYALFISLMGLIINLQHPHIDWINEATVIKQSSAILLTLLSGFLGIAPPILAVIFIKAVSADIILLATIVLIFAVDIALYRYLNTKGVKLFRKL